MADRYQVSSLMIWINAEQFACVRAGIEAIHNAEFLWSDCSNRMVITLRTKSQGEIAIGVAAIESVRGVLNVSRLHREDDHEPADAQRARRNSKTPARCA
jgi:nitrate reductase NapAB chaperone NapD